VVVVDQTRFVKERMPTAALQPRDSDLVTANRRFVCILTEVVCPDDVMPVENPRNSMRRFSAVLAVPRTAWRCFRAARAL